MKKSSKTSIFSSKCQLDTQRDINNRTHQSVPHNLRNQNQKQNLKYSEYSTSSAPHKIPQNCGSTIHCTSEYVPLQVPNKDTQLPRVQSTSPEQQSTMAHVAKKNSTMYESTQGLPVSTLKLPNKSKKHHRPSIHKTHVQIKQLPQKVQQLYHKLTHIFDKITGKKLTLRQLLQNPETTQIWSRSSSNEFGRLMDGNIYGTEGTNTMAMVPPTDVPKDKKVTYAYVVCDYQPLKKMPYRCWLVVEGDKLPYASDSTAPVANLRESKILFNSTISQKTAKFMTIDISNFFLSSRMTNPEFMKIHCNDIPEDIHIKYNSTNYMDNNGYIYFKIIKGMYGLKQAVILA